MGGVAVAVAKEKSSQYALRWAVEHLVHKGQTLFLVHAKQKIHSIPTPLGTRVDISAVTEEVAMAFKQQMDNQIKELFVPFRCYCMRKDLHCENVVLEDNDVAKAIIDYVTGAAIETLVLGAASRHGFFRRFKSSDVPATVSKGAPDFCTVYVISKGKISSVRSASRPAPPATPRQTINRQPSHKLERVLTRPVSRSKADAHDIETIKSPFTRSGNIPGPRCVMEMTYPETDISFVGGTPDNILIPSLYDQPESGKSTPRRRNEFGGMADFMAARTPRISNSHGVEGESPFSDHNRSSFESIQYSTEHSFASHGSGASWSSISTDDVESEMRRLKLELKQTMDMYSNACKEALSAKQKAQVLHHLKMEEEQRREESRLAEEAALALAEKEKAKCKAALEAAEAAQKVAEFEAQKRAKAEMKAHKESEEKRKVLDALSTNVLYRRYAIEEIKVATEFFSEARKIGEGGYGPVYKCYLDHTLVAVKVLRPDAAQGKMQFQQEVEILSCIRHPNMVLLLGACPEYGCLVYEYMACGSLEDRLFRQGNTPSLPWQLRFRIAAEIATGLLFLHQTKPEPLVHRDLKPANILLDQNFVCKISDVGLARLVPPSVANDVTRYRMTSTAGTFHYIDPEYQKTGMLGIKSDVYSLGIMLLQIITGKPPMGLTYFVEQSIDKGTFAELLDPTVPDWPVEEALAFAKISLRCSELKRKDRPDLGSVVLPELNRLRNLAEGSMTPYMMWATPGGIGIPVSQQEEMSESSCGYESMKSHSST